MTPALKFEYKVKLDDLDYMQIVGNGNWMIFLERARIEMLEKIGFPFTEMKKRQIGGVVAEAAVTFKRPAEFNDALIIEITPHTPFEKGAGLKYRITNQRGHECLLADLRMVFVDATGRPTDMPAEIKEKLFTSS